MTNLVLRLKNRRHKSSPPAQLGRKGHGLTAGTEIHHAKQTASRNTCKELGLVGAGGVSRLGVAGWLAKKCERRRQRAQDLSTDVSPSLEVMWPFSWLYLSALGGSGGCTSFSSRPSRLLLDL